MSLCILECAADLVRLAPTAVGAAIAFGFIVKTAAFMALIFLVLGNTKSCLTPSVRALPRSQPGDAREARSNNR
jgi:uncharacterized membrane protein YphA (DoxX/SURF4 family)